MTDPVELDLGPIEARLEAATPGPWHVEQGGEIFAPFWLIGDVLRDRYGNNSISGDDRATIEFIAHARQDVPALVAEVRRLRGQVQRVRVALLQGGQNASIRCAAAIAALDAEAVTE